MKKILSICLLALLLTSNSYPQFKYGADLYSKYIWRGLDPAGVNAPSFQPNITYTIGGLSVGVWGDYTFTGLYAEDDIWASYTYSTETSGSVSLYYTDYYLPSAGIPFGFYKATIPSAFDSTKLMAAHTLEFGLAYTGPDAFPVSLAYYKNVFGEPDKADYIQLSYPFIIKETTLTLTAGGTFRKSAYYVTSKAGLINLGLNVAKTITITDKFSLPINVSYINNPYADISYLVFGVSFTF
jgi:hypothetical protein